MIDDRVVVAAGSLGKLAGKARLAVKVKAAIVDPSDESL
jgi:hypothetical protein